MSRFLARTEGRAGQPEVVQEALTDIKNDNFQDHRYHIPFYVLEYHYAYEEYQVLTLNIREMER